MEGVVDNIRLLPTNVLTDFQFSSDFIKLLKCT